MTNIFDSHAHYDDEAFAKDQIQVIGQLGAGGVTRVLNVACDMESCQTSLALAKKYPFFYCAMGVHPHSAQETLEKTPDYLADLKKYLLFEKAVAIGEIGLDYHYDFSPRPLQIQVFEEQLQLSKELDLPVIIHSREATQDTLELLRQYRPKGVVHCFTGSDQTAREILSLGMYLGYTGAVTFKNIRKVVEAVKITPLDRLLLETDCPYMAPVPFRGKRCDSRMIAQTAQKVAELKEIAVQDLVDQANENACRLFGIV